MSALLTHARFLAQASAVALLCTVAAPATGERPPTRTSPEDEAISIAESTTREGLLAGFAGETESRDAALRETLRVDPDYGLARWHLGQMRRDDQWQTVEQIERQMTDDQQLKEYRSLREAASGNARRQLALARWCRHRELYDAEKLHLRLVLASNPSGPDRKQAMDRLGLQVYGGALLPKEEVQQLETRLAQERKDVSKWTPVVEKWRKTLRGSAGRKRRYALQQLHAVKDPAAIPTLEAQLSNHGEDLALAVVSVLGNIPHHRATESLVSHALELPWDSVIDAAIEQLRRRPLHDYTPIVLRRLVAPIQSTFYVGVAPDGMVTHQHQFFREGPQENHLLTNSFLGGPKFVTMNKVISGARTRGPRGQAARKELAKTQQERLQNAREAAVVRKLTLFQESVRAMRMEQDVAATNTAISQNNDRVFEVLQRTTGTALPNSPPVWWEWWLDYNEVHREDKQIYTHQVGRLDPYYVPWTNVTLMSCFPAGTLVHGQTGLVDIEQIQAGDRVLSQDPESGELAYKLVQQTTVRPPSELLQVTVGGTTVTTTKGHPFWVNNVGWRMAKRLNGGMQLHGIRNGLSIDGIEPAEPAKAYNLVIADFATYFVGQPGVLVHDNTYRKPTTALTPGLIANQRK